MRSDVQAVPPTMSCPCDAQRPMPDAWRYQHWAENCPWTGPFPRSGTQARVVHKAGARRPRKSSSDIPRFAGTTDKQKVRDITGVEPIEGEPLLPEDTE